MSTDSSTPAPAADKKPHQIEQLSRLSVLYLRNALANPRWIDSLEQHLLACDILRALPKIVIPDEVLRRQSDEATLEWGEPILLPLWPLDDEWRDAIRKALRFAFDGKMLPVNDHGADLIKKFNLKK